MMALEHFERFGNDEIAEKCPQYVERIVVGALLSIRC